MYVVKENVIFFFNNETAYEMRISDWSSDVCSSDLHGAFEIGDRCAPCFVGDQGLVARDAEKQPVPGAIPCRCGRRRGGRGDQREGGYQTQLDRHAQRILLSQSGDLRAGRFGERSEEHTSELQSLMRISYAVFCLKKK